VPRRPLENLPAGVVLLPEMLPAPAGKGFGSAQGRDLGCLRAFLALLDVERDALALIQAAVTAALDRGVVHEHVRATTVRTEEAVALLAVEPLDGALCHSCSPRTHSPGTYPGARRPVISRRGPGCFPRLHAVRPTSRRATAADYRAWPKWGRVVAKWGDRKFA